MSKKPRAWLILLLAIILCLCLVKPALREYDAARLRLFTRRVVEADRIVATMYRSPVTVFVSGDQARKLVTALSSATPDRPPLGLAHSASFLDRATFFKGATELGHIDISGPLFLVRARQPPFRDDSGAIETLVEKPLQEAYMDWVRQRE